MMKDVTKMDFASRNSTGNSLTFYKSQMDEDYLKGAKAGDLSKVIECLSNGVKADVTNPGGLNVLHFASRENHPEICRVALKHGVDIKAITKRLNTALHIASLGGHTQVAKILIENGAPINVQAKDDITPLYMAAQENHIDTLKLLLKHGANPHIAARGGFEPLDIAIQQGHVTIVEMLLEKDAKQGMKAMHQAAKKDDKAALKLLMDDDQSSVNVRAPNGYTPLHVAAKFGSVNAANYLIDHGADLNAGAKHNVAPIHVASRHGQTGSISVLIDAGANLGIVTKDGLSALHCAARDGHDRCVELLLVHSAPITSKTKHGLTALHMAAQGNHTASANHLLTNGAHIDDITTDGVTSLHVAAHYGQVETAQLLLEKGASIDQRALNGYTALHIAAKKNREAMVQLLLKYKCSVHIKNNNGQTALHVAAFFGHVNIVLLLLQAGASLEAVTIREETVLHIACRTVQIQIIRLLIRSNAKVNPQTKDGETPLHIACRQGSKSLVSLLLDNYADPNVVNKEGSSALHIASRDGQEEIVESLLDHHAQVSLQSKRGFTPLHEAAKNGNLEVVKTLLERKADVNASGKNGLTPLHIACHYDQPEIVTILLNHGADIHAQAKNGFTPLHISSKKCQVKICRLLFDRGAEADITTRYGVSPLHLSAKEGNLKVVDMLLEHGASPSIQTTNGLSPLHVAVHNNQIQVVKRLLKFTSSIINTPTQTGFTPLHLAASYGHVEMTELLLQSGANVEAKTKTGNTPLHLATVKGHNEIIDLLLKYNAAPNAMNKEGHTALYLAEITQQVVIIQILKKITKVVIKRDPTDEHTSAVKRWEKIRHMFLSPEALEETLLIEASDEIEDTSHNEKKATKDDFEESFAGLEDTKSEHNSPAHQVVEESEISITEQVQVESMAQDHSDFLNSLDDGPGLNGDSVPLSLVADEVPDKGRMVNGYVSKTVYTKTTLIERDYQKIIADNSFITGPPKQGSFLVSFNVDARGATMESKQTGIKITLPPGACQMPTRITLRQRKSDGLPATLSFLPQEHLASRVIQMSPEGMQFLQPVTLQIPHVAALKGKERELIMMRLDSGHSRWKEVQLEENAGNHPDHLTVIIQEVPEKLALVSRPLKERFVMNPKGGEVKSASMPEVSIMFPPQTLNTSTKVVLQTQPIDEIRLAKDNEAVSFGPIVNLDPPTTLSKPINVNMPYPTRKVEGKLHLLAWLPQEGTSPSHSGKGVCVWKNITDTTPLSIVDDNVMFSTTGFTRYWMVKTPDIDSILQNISYFEEKLFTVPYNAECIVFGRLLSPKEAELRIFLITEEFSQKCLVGPNEGFRELARSDRMPVSRGQTINVRIGEDMNSTMSSRNSKIVFQPFKINTLSMKVDLTHALSDGPANGLVSLVNENVAANEAQFCFLVVILDSQMNTIQKVIQYPGDTVNDDVINMVGQQTKNTWFPLADELCMSNRDKQAVIDLSSGKYDVPSVRLLEYWRSKKPSQATYKHLYDALKRSGHDEIAENVYNLSPDEISREIEKRPQSATRQYTVSPTFDTSRYPKKSDSVTHSPTPTSDGLEEDKDDVRYFVSPVLSDDRSTPFTSPTLNIRQGTPTSETPVNDDIHSEVSVTKIEEIKSDDDNDQERSSPSSERWSTVAMYSAQTPDEEKFSVTDCEKNIPATPTSASSDVSENFKSFDSSIKTPLNVSPSVTPERKSSVIEEGAGDDEEENFIMNPPEIDFSSLERLDDGADVLGVDAGKPHEASAYELSLLRKQKEEDKEWEQSHTSKPRNESKEPVAEDFIVDENHDSRDSVVDLTSLEIDYIVVPEFVGEEQAVPYFELPQNERPSPEEKLISGPVSINEVNSSPDFLIDEDNILIAESHQAHSSPTPDSESTPVALSFENETSPVTFTIGTPSEEAKTPVMAESTPAFPIDTSSEESSTPENSSAFDNEVDRYEEDNKMIITHHDEGEIVSHDDGFTKVVKSTTIKESVTVTTKSEVREVSPEELNELIAQQQKQVANGGPAVTRTVVREVEMIDGDKSNNGAIEGVVMVTKSDAVEVSNDADVKTIRRKEVEENTSVVEISLNPDENDMSGEELIKKMFGNQDNVLEFFKDGDEAPVIEGNHNDVGKVDEYGTQV